MEEKTEAREYLKGEGELEQRLIKIAYGRRWGSRPILIPLHKALKLAKEMRQDIPKLEAGSFSKLPDGTINDFWAKEVIDFFQKWLK